MKVDFYVDNACKRQSMVNAYVRERERERRPNVETDVTVVEQR